MSVDPALQKLLDKQAIAAFLAQGEGL